MPIESASIDAAQVERILLLEEDHFHDLKAVEIAPAKLTKTISAFANADGGEVYIGIDEDVAAGKRTWRGFANIEAANAHLAVFQGSFPLGQYYSYTFLTSEGLPGCVLFVEIRKSSDVKAASNGTVYLRHGAQSLPIDSDEKLRRLELDKGFASFESETIAVEYQVLTESEVTDAFIANVVPTSTPEKWLRKQRLILNDRPSVAGVVLFADEPQAIFPKHCAIKIYRYQTQDPEGSRETLVGHPGTVEGCLYDQIEAAVRQTKGIIEGVKKMGVGGLEQVVYPDETLHEIITNAVLHRDYSLADDVHVRIFDDRVEVESPGRLPGHVTVENILRERFARNGNVVRVINKFPNPPNKDVGEGLNTAFDAMTKLRLKEPSIAQKEHSVIVYIRHEPLASPESIILEYLETHESIGNATVRELTHIRADWLVRSMFKALEERKLIERVPGTRTSSTAYRKPVF
jgi:ATP-dependent DNA helicase RecG